MGVIQFIVQWGITLILLFGPGLIAFSRKKILAGIVFVIIMVTAYKVAQDHWSISQPNDPGLTAPVFAILALSAGLFVAAFSLPQGDE